jgi:hypothetical protein
MIQRKNIYKIKKNHFLTSNYSKKNYLNILNKIFSLDNYNVKAWHNNYCLVISSVLICCTLLTYSLIHTITGVQDSIACWGTMLQAGKLRAQIMLRSLHFFNLPNLSSCTMTFRLTQLLTELSTRHLPVRKAQPEHKADNLTAICEPTV